VQLVIRIHPGEAFTKGPSVAEVVRGALPGADLPEHIHLIPADAKVNSYDIFEIAGLGLVYTTTAGLEMAMSGVPVIAVGNTHYAARDSPRPRLVEPIFCHPGRCPGPPGSTA
jgi:hypothetical protein